MKRMEAVVEARGDFIELIHTHGEHVGFEMQQKKCEYTPVIKLVLIEKNERFYVLFCVTFCKT